MTRNKTKNTLRNGSHILALSTRAHSLNEALPLITVPPMRALTEFNFEKIAGNPDGRACASVYIGKASGLYPRRSPRSTDAGTGTTMHPLDAFREERYGNQNAYPSGVLKPTECAVQAEQAGSEVKCVSGKLRRQDNCSRQTNLIRGYNCPRIEQAPDLENLLRAPLCSLLEFFLLSHFFDANELNLIVREKKTTPRGTLQRVKWQIVVTCARMRNWYLCAFLTIIKTSRQSNCA